MMREMSIVLPPTASPSLACTFRSPEPKVIRRRSSATRHLDFDRRELGVKLAQDFVGELHTLVGPDEVRFLTDYVGVVLLGGGLVAIAHCRPHTLDPSAGSLVALGPARHPVDMGLARGSLP